MNEYKLPELYDKGNDLNKRWFVAYYYRHPETKKFVIFRLWISTYLKTKQARRNKALELIQIYSTKLRSGFNPFQSEIKGYSLLIDVLRMILDIKKTSTRYRTVHTYESYYNIFVSWLELSGLKNVYVENFSFSNALAFSDYLKIDKRVKNRTHNNYIQCLRTLFNNIVEREYILINPFRKVKYLPEEEGELKRFTIPELKTLKNYCIENDHQLWLICLMIYYGGLRPAEIVRLKIKDFDLVNCKIYVSGFSSKNKKNAVIMIAPDLESYLKKFELDQLDPDLFLFSNKLLPGPNQIFPTRLAERFKKVAKELNIKRNLYDLKHTGAGTLLQEGANPKDIQLHLRHSSLEMTDIYLRRFQSQPSKDFYSKFKPI